MPLGCCDTTTKVGPKLACLRKPLNLELIKDFCTGPLSDEMMSKAEQFLLERMTNVREAKTFDVYRYEQYRDVGQLDFNELTFAALAQSENTLKGLIISV